jgi:predicted TIM-barrel fold metal-dependent hydrolase
MRKPETPAPGNKPRREILQGVAAGVAGLLTGTAAGPARAQSAAQFPSLKVIDFHNHFIGSAFTPIVGTGAPAARRAYFDAVNRNLADSRALLASIESAGIAARVVNTPLEFIQDPDAETSPDTIAQINDQLADLVRRNPGRLYGLATVDAYSGEAGARELIRAVRELNLRGAFVQAAKKELFLDTPQARPTLAAAAALGVPVFVHPITDAQLRGRFGRYGRPGVTLNRSTINSAALIALLEGGTFDELPNLRVVVTTLAIGAILLAGGLDGNTGLRRDAPELSRRHVYIDTMGLHPVLIRSVVDMLGADHVLAGTDWPIYVEQQIPERLQAALSACGLNAAEQQLVAGGNTAKLLGVT